MCVLYVFTGFCPFSFLSSCAPHLSCICLISPVTWALPQTALPPHLHCISLLPVFFQLYQPISSFPVSTVVLFISLTCVSSSPPASHPLLSLVCISVQSFVQSLSSHPFGACDPAVLSFPRHSHCGCLFLHTTIFLPAICCVYVHPSFHNDRYNYTKARVTVSVSKWTILQHSKKGQFSDTAVNKLFHWCHKILWLSLIGHN